MPAAQFTAEDRQTSVLFRLSHDERTKLRADAEELGITVQALLERRVLNKYVEGRRHGGRKPKDTQQETLPLTG